MTDDERDIGTIAREYCRAVDDTEAKEEEILAR